MEYEVFLVRQPGRPQRGTSRILRFFPSSLSISTMTPSSNTVHILYHTIVNVTLSRDDPSEFSFGVEDGRRQDTYKLACDTRAALLTSLYNKLDDINEIGTDFPAKKHSIRTGTYVDKLMRVRSASLVKMKSATPSSTPNAGRDKGLPTKRINMYEIQRLEVASDDDRVVLIHVKSRVIRLSLRDGMAFILTVQRNMKEYLGIDKELNVVSTDDMMGAMEEEQGELLAKPFLYEFSVFKHLGPDGNMVDERVLRITNDELIELLGDEVACAHSLRDVLGVVVEQGNDTEVVLEYKSWRRTHYHVEERDAFVASLGDVMDLMDIDTFTIRLEPMADCTLPGRVAPVVMSDLENHLLSRLWLTFTSDRDPLNWFPVIREYFCNIQVGDSLCVEPKLLDAVADLMTDSFVKRDLGPRYTLPCCIVLERLLYARTCFEAIRNHPEVISSIFSCIRGMSSVVSYSAARALRATLRFRADAAGMSENAILQRESANKLAVLTPDNVQQLCALLRMYATTSHSPLEVVGILGVLIAAVNSPLLDTEYERQYLKSLEGSLMSTIDLLCVLCRSSCDVIYHSNAVLFHVLLVKMEESVQNHLKKEALSQGIVLAFLKHAIFSKSQRVCELSGVLVYLLMEEETKETRRLLSSILPKGVMLLYEGKIAGRGSPDRDVKVACWLETLHALKEADIVIPTLVWNDLKRTELLKFLDDEIEAFDHARELSNEATYNHSEAHLIYSPDSENNGTIVRGIHLEVLVDEPEQENDSYGSPWKLQDPQGLFQSLFHSLMLGFTVLQERGVAEVDLQLAVHALSWVYERYSQQLTDVVSDLMMIEISVEMLREAYDNEQKVLAFKLLSFLLLMMEMGGREQVLRFVRTNGERVMVPMIIRSLAMCCYDVHAFESGTVAPLTMKRWSSITVSSLSAASFRSEKANWGQPDEERPRSLSFRSRAGVRWVDQQIDEMLLFGLGLDTLETMLRISCADTSSAQFPPPKAVLSLGMEEIICHLAQMLLRAQDPIFGRIMKIVKGITAANKAALAKVYRLGIFEILLWKLICGSISEADRLSIAEFLSASHLLQSPDALAHSQIKGRGRSENAIWQESILRLFFPEGVIMKLITEGPYAFIELMSSEEESPEVIWNDKMRNRLVKHLEKLLGEYVKARAENPLALYLFFPRPALAYPELADAVYSTPLYLQNLLDTNHFADYVMADPAAFHSSLMQDLRSVASGMSQSGVDGVTAEWHNSMKRILLLLRAQGFVLQQYPQIHLPADTETVLIDVASPALYVCSSMGEATPPSAIEILHQCLRVLRRVAASSDEDHDVSSTALDFAMSVLEVGQNCKVGDDSLAEPGFSEMLESALASAFCITELAASSREGRQQLSHDTRWRRGLWWALGRAIADISSSDTDKEASSVDMAALNCLNHFAGDEKFCFEAVKLGLHLPLLLLAVPEEAIQVKVRSQELGQSSLALLNSAVTALRTLVQTLNLTGGMEQSTGQPMGRAAFLGVLPMALLFCLEEDEDGPAKFIQRSALNLEQPMAIWNEPVRLELWQRVKERFESHSEVVNDGADFEGNELEWLFNFSYESLKGQLVIGGIFIQGFASGQWEGFNLPDGAEFLESIQDFLHDNLKVVAIGSADNLSEVFEDSGDETEETGSVDGSNQMTVEDYMTVMRAFEECLKYCIQEQREELLIQFRFGLFARIARSRAFLVEAKTGVCKLVQVLAKHDGMREELVFSELWGALTVQLWESMVAHPEEGTEEVMMATLEVLLVISQEIPATVSATNCFSSGSVLLPILALFLKIKLPPLQGQESTPSIILAKHSAIQSPLRTPLAESPKSVIAAPPSPSPPIGNGEVDISQAVLSKLANVAEPNSNGNVKMEDAEGRSSAGVWDIPNTARIKAARIIGHILLASQGMSRSASSLKKLQGQKRTAMSLEDCIRNSSDMYELSNWIEPGMEDGTAEPFVVRILLLFLPIQILAVLAHNPEQACVLEEQDRCTPLLVWNDSVRHKVKSALLAEVDKLQESAKIRGKHGFLPWHVAREKPVFLRWILSVVADDEGSNQMRDDYADGYAMELYVGGFYIDQYLRNPDFDFGEALEQRFLRELTKYVAIVAPTHSAHAAEFSYDDRRRLLLSLLFLLKGRPSLLTGSSIVIFLSVYDFISGGSVEDYHGLVQPALLLFHCSAHNHDIADYMITDELMILLSGLLSLCVPDLYAGIPATDPRICSLNLLLRLIRLSTRAVEISIAIALLAKIADIVVDVDGAVAVRQRAAEVLAVMCADKRRGIEVSRRLDKRIPASTKGYGAWQIPLSKIDDPVADNKTLRHFARNRFPSPWWKAQASDDDTDVSDRSIQD